MKIAIQGIKGSFHHQAAVKMFPNDEIELVECRNFRQVFESITGDSADYGLVALENNLHGSINEVYRLLQKHDVWISKDLRLHISQNLIVHNPLNLEILKTMKDLKVISHPVALAQVDDWLTENLPHAYREEHSDTAASVKHIKELGRDNCVAVASKFACEMYGGHIVASDIQDDKNNYTRFIVFSKVKTPVDSPTHCSIILTTDHKPGALLRALEVFNRHAVNLTKLDSQPLAGDTEHYSFYIDYDLNENKDLIIPDLTSLGCQVKVLGEYIRLN